MLKGQDILVLLRLIGGTEDWTVRAIGASVGLDPAGAHRSLRRLDEVRLVDVKRQRVNRSSTEELLIHGLKYVFPGRQTGMSRGMPTAWAAPPLSDELAATGEPPPVWPDPDGDVRGLALEPLHEKAPEVARRDPESARRLALIDAIRIGDGRVRSLAETLLSRSLEAGGSSS